MVDRERAGIRNQEAFLRHCCHPVTPSLGSWLRLCGRRADSAPENSSRKERNQTDGQTNIPTSCMAEVVLDRHNTFHLGPEYLLIKCVDSSLNDALSLQDPYCLFARGALFLHHEPCCFDRCWPQRSQKRSEEGGTSTIDK